MIRLRLWTFPFMIFIMLAPITTEGLSKSSSSSSSKTYRYFAFGSNVVQSTMTALREIQPLDASAAVLSGYRLRFNIGGILDGAAASVERASQDCCVHGVLYTLTSRDFARVGLTEGVPLAYRWEKCRVVPYVGDGNDSGRRALMEQDPSVEAYTLVASSAFLTTTTTRQQDSRPSRSYLDLLIRGAKDFSMDREYVDVLQATPVAENLIPRDGFAGILLRQAELRQQWRSKA